MPYRASLFMGIFVDSGQRFHRINLDLNFGHYEFCICPCQILHIEQGILNLIMGISLKFDLP